jgi:poly(3-hydroxyalkanoate) synthetase
LHTIDVPFFFVAGNMDQLAPPAAVIDAYARVSSTDKRLTILSRANGYRGDYGHVDLILGRDAPAEVYPAIAKWLIAHDTP